MSPQLRGQPSSALSAFAASFYDRHSDFHYLDGDMVLFAHKALPIVAARETRVLRILEHKRLGEDLTRSQRQTLPILAAALEAAIANGDIRAPSGVFVITGEAPDFTDGATVGRIRADTAGGEWSAISAQYEWEKHLTRAQLEMFLRCRSA